MKLACTALVLAIAGLCPAAALAQPGTESAEWEVYTNERFGFSLRYPASVFHVERRSEAGDGLVFITKDGETRLLAGAFPNSDKFTVASYQDYVVGNSYADSTVTYRRSGDTWFVVSGVGRGRIFYEKVMFACDGQLINSFAILYPTDQRATFDPIVERIEDSFRPATRCETRRPRAAEKRSPPARAAVRTRGAPRARAGLPRGDWPRSALADRIARERGRDVIVILRRSEPPYDRRIVRGYVSR